jgi:hypothetical protein
VKHDRKNIKNKKTNKNHRGGTRNKTKGKIGSNLFCIVRDHPDPFDGALSSFEILS